ncbi:hypothetical protein QUF72_19995 [Desulfobacterales bacterium HSG2]|nr:hypothetical protein [Desulfobacterales bacterium HSG2]
MPHLSHYVALVRTSFRPGSFVTVEVDSGSELKKCPIFSILPGMTGGGGPKITPQKLEFLLNYVGSKYLKVYVLMNGLSGRARQR